MHARRSAVFTTAALLTALGACGPTQAQSLSDMLSRGGACFARTYDEAHLRAHTDQTKPPRSTAKTPDAASKVMISGFMLARSMVS